MVTPSPLPGGGRSLHIDPCGKAVEPPPGRQDGSCWLGRAVGISLCRMECDPDVRLKSVINSKP